MQGHMNVEVPVKTDVQLMREAQEAQGEKLDKLIEAVNGLGGNVQWIIDNVQGIFQMFGNPQMMAMLAPMMNGAMASMPGAGDDDQGDV